MDEYVEENRTEQNLTVRSGKSEADVTNNKRQRSIVLLKLTTDKHEASPHGLSATAELLVFGINLRICLAVLIQYRRMTDRPF